MNIYEAIDSIISLDPIDGNISLVNNVREGVTFLVGLVENKKVIASFICRPFHSLIDNLWVSKFFLSNSRNS